MSLEDFCYNLWRESLWKSSAKIAAMIASFFHPGVAIVLLLIFLPFYLLYKVIKIAIKLAIVILWWLGRFYLVVFATGNQEEKIAAIGFPLCVFIFFYLGGFSYHGWFWNQP